MILPLTVDTYMRRCDDLTCFDGALVEILDTSLCTSVMWGKAMFTCQLVIGTI